MAVYVDDARIPTTRGRYGYPWKMSHMIADTRVELDEIAEAIELDQKWKQAVGEYNEHFDVTESYRRRAIQFGAKPISARQLAAKLLDRDFQAYFRSQP